MKKIYRAYTKEGLCQFMGREDDHQRACHEMIVVVGEICSKGVRRNKDGGKVEQRGGEVTHITVYLWQRVATSVWKTTGEII